jgi:hypothetical protein
MKILPKYLKKNGFELIQMFRHGNVALYRKRKPDQESEHFEVIRVQSHKGYTVQGVKIPPSEHFPSDEQWGTHGWTFMTGCEAAQKYHSLLDEDS